MCDEWMSVINLPITIEEFHQLPRNSAFKYEYFKEHACLTPRPKFYHALLDLDCFKPGEPLAEISVRPLEDRDVSKLEPVFAGAFAHHQPYSGLDGDRRLQAAQQALAKACGGGDGPLIRQASFVAFDGEDPLGAILVTLVPDADPCDWGSYQWTEPPPLDWLVRRLGRPHITWVFVNQWHACRGVGSALLAASVAALKDLGYKELASTFLLGNDSSMLWHWRNGFKLQAYPGSRRRLKRLFHQRQGQPKQ